METGIDRCTALECMARICLIDNCVSIAFAMALGDLFIWAEEEVLRRHSNQPCGVRSMAFSRQSCRNVCVGGGLRGSLRATRYSR